MKCVYYIFEYRYSNYYTTVYTLCTLLSPPWLAMRYWGCFRHLHSIIPFVNKYLTRINDGSFPFYCNKASDMNRYEKYCSCSLILKEEGFIITTEKFYKANIPTSSLITIIMANSSPLSSKILDLEISLLMVDLVWGINCNWCHWATQIKWWNRITKKLKMHGTLWKFFSTQNYRTEREMFS